MAREDGGLKLVPFDFSLLCKKKGGCVRGVLYLMQACIL